MVIEPKKLSADELIEQGVGLIARGMFRLGDKSLWEQSQGCSGCWFSGGLDDKRDGFRVSELAPQPC